MIKMHFKKTFLLNFTIAFIRATATSYERKVTGSSKTIALGSSSSDPTNIAGCNHMVQITMSKPIHSSTQNYSNINKIQYILYSILRYLKCVDVFMLCDSCALLNTQIYDMSIIGLLRKTKNNNNNYSYLSHTF